jgi:uncharacterized protein (TIGR00297 family)
LSLLGILAAAGTATIHALHPSALPFTLLCSFFLLGTAATKVKHEVKSTLTLTSGGGSGGEGPRTSIQVLANSGFASLLCLVHVVKYGIGSELPCFSFTSQGGVISSLALTGIVANYVSVTADTLSSELGILSRQQPILITNPFRRVPRGTNGGVTLGGVLYGLLGSTAIAAISLPLLPFCSTTDSGLNTILSFFFSTTEPKTPTWASNEKFLLTAFFSLWGMCGSLLDSLLGALLQASVIDTRTGKVVEGAGGVKVLTRSSFSSSRKQNSPTSSSFSKRKRPQAEVKSDSAASSRESRTINSGKDLLDNNQINFLMASSMSVGAMVLVSVVCGVRVADVLS